MQVDLFLAYGTGAMFTASAARQTHAGRRAPASRRFRLLSAPLFPCVLFHALLLAPACVWLLARFPAWETMQVMQSAPVWARALFGAATVAFGIAGCIAGRRLSAKGNLPAAYANLTAPWTLTFVVLTYGWDGQGYCRFLSPTTFDPASCASRPLRMMAGEWARSDIAIALAAVVVVGVSAAVAVMTCLHATGARQEGLAATRSVPAFLGFVVGGVLLPSVVVAVLAAATAWTAGPAAGAGVLASLLLLCSTIGCAHWRTPLSAVLMQGAAPASRAGVLTDAG
ncbi:hypothetical protein Sviol_60670 [Streptomyces violascens]|uniref:Uncharacterized protein n=2 Tax=Streptomyces violascens TaxID=67381 RepID=A0ABQ3QWR2_9ACTN|nr:hypothetical protein Sviol_60670 [Streptomyces violascens]